MTNPRKKKRVRKIVVNDTEFSWRFATIVDVRTNENKNNKLAVDFGWDDIWGRMNDLERPNDFYPQIATPKFVAKSIKYAIQNGWDINSKSGEFKIIFKDDKYSVFDPV